MTAVLAKHKTVPVPLEEVLVENTFVRDLPADEVRDNVPRPVRNAAYTRVEPTPVAAPRLLAGSDELGEYLGIERPSYPTGLVAPVLGGSKTLPGMQPYAARSGGPKVGPSEGQPRARLAISLCGLSHPGGLPRESPRSRAGQTP